MSKGLFDDQKIDTACPACGHKTKQTIARLRSEPKLTCPSCGNSFQVEFTGGAELDKADKAVADLRKTLAKLGKRR